MFLATDKDKFCILNLLKITGKEIINSKRDDIRLAVDKTSEMYIMGSTIDYVQELMGSFLKIDNPLTKSSCGCGESFSV